MFYSLNVFLFKYLENITLEMIIKKLYLLVQNEIFYKLHMKKMLRKRGFDV